MNRPPARFLLAASLLATLSACDGEAPEAAAAGSSRRLRVETFDPPVAKARAADRLETLHRRSPEAAAATSPPVAAPSRESAQAPDGPAAAAAPGAPGALVPQGRPPGAEPYEPFPGRAAAPAQTAPEPPGFRITLPLCRRAERAQDPLAQTPECTALLRAGAEQQRLCAQAFEDGNDAVVLSPACRQAAGAR